MNNKNQQQALPPGLNFLKQHISDNPHLDDPKYLLPHHWDEVAQGNTYDPSYYDITFKSNASSLLGRVISDAIKKGEVAKANHYLDNFAAGLNIDTPGGYGVELGYHQPNPVHPGQKLDWNAKVKFPLDF